MSKYTPGPWIITKGDSGVQVTTKCKKTFVAFISFVRSPKNIADGKLIAAAPDMLEALQAALKLSDDWYNAQLEAGYELVERTPECQAVYDKVNAAIEKATI